MLGFSPIAGQPIGATGSVADQAGLVSASLAAAYAISNLVQASLVASYEIENLPGNQMFTPSTARTVTVSPGAKPFTAGDLWNMSDPKKPRSPKDSDSTVDYSFNWEPWLLDVVDGIASHDIQVTEGLANEGSSVTGSVVTVFVSGGTNAKRAALTCRVTTSSTPPRVEDRTIYLDIEAA